MGILVPTPIAVMETNGATVKSAPVWSGISWNLLPMKTTPSWSSALRLKSVGQGPSQARRRRDSWASQHHLAFWSLLPNPFSCPTVLPPVSVQSPLPPDPPLTFPLPHCCWHPALGRPPGPGGGHTSLCCPSSQLTEHLSWCPSWSLNTLGTVSAPGQEAPCVTLLSWVETTNP